MTDWTQQPPPPTLGGRMRAAGRGAESMLAEEMDAEHLLAEHRAACQEIKRLRAVVDLVAGMGVVRFIDDGDDVWVQLHAEGDPLTPAAHYITPDDAALLRSHLNVSPEADQ